VSHTVCARVAQYIGCKIDEKFGSKDRLVDQVVGRSGSLYDNSINPYPANVENRVSSK